MFSYNAGTGWMSGNGVLKSVIINKGTSTEMLNAMYLWTKNASLSRRLVEVNMYMNGIYSNTTPDRYGFVEYDPKGGSMPQHDASDSDGEYTFYFDLHKTMEHPVVPTKAGYIFLGWYVDEGWAPTLKGALDGLQFGQSKGDEIVSVTPHLQIRLGDKYLVDLTYEVDTTGKEGVVRQTINARILMVRTESGLKVESIDIY